MLTLLGIRHHGPGSARSVCAELEKLRPDALLVEGPPEADSLLPLAAHAEMKPPVALLLYPPAQPQNAIYYPFAEFSPEWQAIQYALRQRIPLRFMDLPYSPPAVDEAEPVPQPPSLDPFSLIAEAAGYADGERWWEHFVEQRRASGDIFQGILELMSALRAEVEPNPFPTAAQDLRREAAMRTIIRSTQAEGCQRIAVVCGAWHTPALLHPEDYPEDARRLKGLPKTEVAAAWIPWTYSRLARRSGYGAGIEAPGWYEHLWQTQAQIVESWLTKIAHTLREEDLGLSPAHIIEAVRLAETLAALRQRPLPGLPELNEAVQAIFCFGDDAPLRLIHEKLIVGQRMGQTPAEAPAVPLQRDLAAAQKRTRLAPSAAPEMLDLDLRKPLLLERSQLLHRLNLLGIPWGRLETRRGAKGTFHEVWQVEWKPELAVAVIEASPWGNTVLEAAGHKLCADAAAVNELPALTRLVEAALLADVAEAIPILLQRLQQTAALSGDVSRLMEALPPLANVLRYGSVRQTDASLVQQVVDELAARICIGLPTACLALDDDAAQAMFEQINAMQHAIEILQDEAQSAAWERALQQLAAQEAVHGLLRGRASRLLFERGEEEPTARRMSQALSPGTPAAQSAAWLQGFLHGSGQALIHHPRLWQVLDEWVAALPEAAFTSLLPLLRRTFSAFPAPERFQIGEMARRGGERAAAAGVAHALDAARAEKALQLVWRIVGRDAP